MKNPIHILAREVVSRGFGILEKISFERKRSDAQHQQLTREIYEVDDGAAILLYDPTRRTVILVRQLRLPAYLKEGRASMIEVCAGKLEGADPAQRIILEAEEETGIVVTNPKRVFEAYVSPGCFSEKLFFFVARYSPADRKGNGGGLAHEGEDIEVLELSFDKALAMIETGEIVDAKTIMLLHYAKFAGLLDAS